MRVALFTLLLEPSRRHLQNFSFASCFCTLYLVFLTHWTGRVGSYHYYLVCALLRHELGVLGYLYVFVCARLVRACFHSASKQGVTSVIHVLRYACCNAISTISLLAAGDDPDLPGHVAEVIDFRDTLRRYLVVIADRCLQQVNRGSYVSQGLVHFTYGIPQSSSPASQLWFVVEGVGCFHGARNRRDDDTFEMVTHTLHTTIQST